MALIKYLEFGGIDHNTGENRVTLLDNNLIKVASNEIQDYWNNLVRKPECFYLHVIAMSAGEYWGPNKRADWYSEENLKKYHELFVTQAKVYKHHINRSDSPSYGRVLYSYYNDNMHRVELILEVDKKDSLEYVEKIKNGENIYVSMGMRVPKDECSICGNIATRLDEYCEHGKLLKNKILEDDRLVYRINHAPYNLFDISLVTRPADPVAWAMEKAAQDQGKDAPMQDSSNTMAVYDEDVYNTATILKTAVDKFADLIKEVELQPMEQETGEEAEAEAKAEAEAELLQTSPEKSKIHIFIQRNKALPIPIKLPSFNYEQLEGLNIRPSLPILGALLGNTHLSLDELAYYIGKIFLKKAFNEHIHRTMLASVPVGIHNLQRNPVNLVNSIVPIVEDFIDFNKRNHHIDHELHKLKAHKDNAESTAALLKHAGLTSLENSPYNNPEDYFVRNVAYNKNIVELVNKNDPLDVYLAKKEDAKFIVKNGANHITGDLVKIVGGVTALAGVASMLTGKSEDILKGTPAVVLGGILMSKGLSNDNTADPKGFELIEKRASRKSLKDIVNQNLLKLANVSIGTVTGIAIPAALAADYAYTRHRATKNPAIAREIYENPPLTYKLGQKVIENPALSVVASLGSVGALKGSGRALGHALLMKRRRF